MAEHDPDNDDFLAIVSEWTTTTPRGGVVGNAYPIMNLTTGDVLTDPQEVFPNPGAVFLTSRTNLKTWDFVFLRPQVNRNYSNGYRQCYFISARPPDVFNSPIQCEDVAVVLEHPAFDPSSAARQLQNPRHNVTPLFFVQKNQTIFGPLIRDVTLLSPIEDIQRIDWRPARDDGIIYEFTREELAEKGLQLAQYAHPEPSLNRILAAPILLAFGPALRATSSRPRDVLSDASLIEWYLARCPTVSVSS